MLIQYVLDQLTQFIRRLFELVLKIIYFDLTSYLE